MAKEIIKIDSELEPLIPTYLENQKNNLQKMQEALHKKDFGALQVLGHNLKGSGGGYGFETLSSIGASIEQAAKNSDAATLGTKLSDLEEYLGKIDVVFI